jgi:hypothetical protein
MGEPVNKGPETNPLNLTAEFDDRGGNQVGFIDISYCFLITYLAAPGVPVLPL